MIFSRHYSQSDHRHDDAHRDDRRRSRMRRGMSRGGHDHEHRASRDHTALHDWRDNGYGGSSRGPGERLSDLMDSAEDFLRATASYSGAEIEDARARIKTQLESAREHLQDHRGRRMAGKVARAARESGRYVGDHKWQTAGIAAAVAAVTVGVIAGMKRKD